MGILQGRNTASTTSVRFDPFEGLDDSISDKNLFADLSVIPDRPLLRRPPSKQVVDVKSRPNRRLISMLALGLLVVFSGFTVARFKPWTYFDSQEIVYAYFEVRALDGSGRPIAGAVVKNGGKRVGTTDSFGEWRRYMKVPLGATVPLTIAKKSANHILLYATKNFAVPPEKSEKSDIELRGSVQLQAVDSNDVDAKSAVNVVAADMIGPRSGTATTGKDAAKGDSLALTTTNGDQASKEKSASPALPAKVTNGANPPQDKPQFVSTHESLWFELNGSQASALNREVLPALRKRASELGLHVDPNARWKIRLSSLIEKPERIEKDGGGLILVSSFDGEKNGVSREFLRVFSPDAAQTAKGILFSLAHHVNKNVSIQKSGDRWVASLPKTTSDIWKLAAGQDLTGDGGTFVLSGDTYGNDHLSGFYLTKTESDPCVKGINGCELKTKSFGDVPPLPSWKKLRLKLASIGKDPVKVFVSGYEAQQVGDKLFEYWGQDRSRANVTIIQAGRVMYRGQIVNDKSGPVSLGLGNISRR